MSTTDVTIHNIRNLLNHNIYAHRIYEMLPGNLKSTKTQFRRKIREKHMLVAPFIVACPINLSRRVRVSMYSAHQKVIEKCLVVKF